MGLTCASCDDGQLESSAVSARMGTSLHGWVGDAVILSARSSRAMRTVLPRAARMHSEEARAEALRVAHTTQQRIVAHKRISRADRPRVLNWSHGDSHLGGVRVCAGDCGRATGDLAVFSDRHSPPETC